MECKICFQEYDQNKYTPMILNCGHTVCIDCTYRLTNNKCPFCKNIINNTSKNYSLIDIISEKNNNKFININNYKDCNDSKNHNYENIQICIINYPNGNTYEGKTLRGRPEGNGICHFADGGYYEGEYINGKPNGIGIKKWKNNNIYEGLFLDGKMNGYGKLIYSDGRIFQGNYIDGKKNGIGELSWPNGNKYNGNFENDQLHGKGKMHYSDGSKFNGEFKNGFPFLGIKTFKNGKIVNIKTTIQNNINYLDI